MFCQPMWYPWPGIGSAPPAPRRHGRQLRGQVRHHQAIPLRQVRLVMRAQFMCVTISKFLLLLDSPQSTQRPWRICSVVISASPVQTTPLRWTFSTLRGRASSRQCGGEYGGNFRILPPERCVTQACLLDVTFPNPSLTLHVPPLPLVS